MKTKTTQISIAAALIGVSITGTALADPMSWQERRLFQPTATQLAAESRGQVMIYDRMDSGVVDKALDNEFSRMENMMFIRVQDREPEGTVEEDDDC